MKLDTGMTIRDEGEPALDPGKGVLLCAVLLSCPGLFREFTGPIFIQIETLFLAMVLVGYLTPDSDLDLAPDPDQFGALPPIRYINL